MKKRIALALVAGMLISTVNVSAYEAGSFEGVSITMLNTKSEIQQQLEAAAELWGEATGATLEVYTIGSGSPSQEIAARYAAKNAPTLIMGDPQDVAAICVEKGVDLTAEPWVAVGGEQYGISVDGAVYGFPFCIEGRGIIYNKTVIDELLGEAWDPASVTSMDDFVALLDKLVEAGMEAPVALNMEDWSLAGHYLTQVYEQQDNTLATCEQFMADLKAGSVDLEANERFTSLFNTFDVLKQYNINAADPLAADYATNVADVAEGTVAFYFNGNWCWGEMKDYYEEGVEVGIMPVPQNEVSENELVKTTICGSATKHVMIDKECNDETQQAAAKDFLNWLVDTEEGVNVLINECSLVPAFSTIDQEATNPLGRSVQNYAKAGLLADAPSSYPGDHWQQMGATMQKYLADQIDRAGLADEIEAYWAALAE